MRKFLYFRTVADEANDGVTGTKTNNPSSFMFNADDLTAMQPTDDAILTLYFKPALAHNKYDTGLRDTVNLNVNEGDHFEVMSKITDAIANPARGHSDGFVVIANAFLAAAGNSEGLPAGIGQFCSKHITGLTINTEV